MYCYINGISDKSKSGSSSLVSGGKTIFGRRSTKEEAYFNGKLDDIRIYNRALTEAEIQQLYNE